MKNNKKILSVIAALALSSTMVVGATAFTGCGDNKTDSNSNTTNTTSTTVVNTALGASVYDSEAGNTYYASPDVVTNEAHAGSEADPFYLPSILQATALTNNANTSNKYLQPGDTLLLLPSENNGEYSFNTTLTITVSGAFNQYIRIMNATLVDSDASNDKEIVIKFYDQSFASTSRGIQLYGNYIYWYGIDIAGAGDNGMYVGGSYNTVEYCEFYDNRDTGLQIGRAYSELTTIDRWPSYNLILNCTSHNNYDNESFGENADGFAAKLTVGYGNVFDGCIAYRNSDDGWDLFAKADSGNIGTVILYNCIAFENGYLEYPSQDFNKKFETYNSAYNESVPNTYVTRDGDGNGFKLGGSTMEGDSILVNCLAFNNRMHGVTDNSNPGVITLDGVTSYNNSALIDNAPQINVGTEAAPSMQDNDNFGQIKAAENHDTHGNINVSRQTYSYNNLNGVLSVKDSMAKSLTADEYRGSAANSILLSASAQYKITDSIDADSKNGNPGESIAALVAADVFTTLPITLDGTTYTFNLSGRNDLVNAAADRVHNKYRNDDGSINLGEILDVKVADLLGNGKAIGSDLNKASSEEYSHFYTLAADGSTSSDAAIVAKVKEALVVPTDTAAVYQDFMLPATMTGIFVADRETSAQTQAQITWSSNRTSVISINLSNINSDSLSGSTYYTAIVNRTNADETVVLTATIKYGSATQTKQFTLNVKTAIPSIGEITLRDADGDILNDGETVIVDRFDDYQLPTIYVENGMDYNGKLLASSEYVVDTTYMYATDSSSHQVEIKGFTSSNAGVYEVTFKVKLVGEETYGGSMTITVYVASTNADVDFESTPEVLLSSSGYTIGGDLSSATGYIYVVTSATEITTGLGATTIATYEGVVLREFRVTTLSESYDNANNAEYYVYYALGNINGEVTSEVYSQHIAVVDIDTNDKFATMAHGTAIDGEEPSATIYKLTQNLDFTSVSWTASGTFTGLFNGMGYAIENLATTQKAIFNEVNGGMIMNVKFNNIKITASAQKVGIVSECTGGYFYNIAMTDVHVTSSNQRVGGLIGSIVACNSPVIIDQVSLINTTGYEIKSSASRAGGIIGFIQPSSSSALTTMVDVRVSNCYVNTTVSASEQAGGIVGTYHANGMSTKIYVNLSVTKCIVTGRIASTSGASKLGGILGNHADVGAAQITYCLSTVTLDFNGDVLSQSIKNASPIVGVYAAAANVETYNCLSLFGEYNTNYDVTALNPTRLTQERTYFDNLTYLLLDKTKWTLVKASGEPDAAIVAPYISLNFFEVEGGATTDPAEDVA